jgi:photosystem II stability/assembly factor-like uncharacterized protein
MKKKYLTIMIWFFLFRVFGIDQEIILEQKNTGLYGGSIRAILPVSAKDALCGTNNGIYHWSDQNKNWLKCSTFPPFLCNNLVEDDSGNIFADAIVPSIGCNPLLEGLYRSDNIGILWEKLPFPDKTLLKIIFDGKNNRLVAGNTTGIYQSTTSGNTWDTLALLGKEVANIAINSKNHIFIASPNSGVLKSDSSNRVWYTSNNGINNIDIRSIFIDSSDNIFTGGSMGEIYTSKDTGYSWVKDTQLDGTITFFKYSINNNAFFAGTPRGLYQYSKTDNSWKLASAVSPFDELYYNCIAENGSNGFLIGTERSGVVAVPKSDALWNFQNDGLYNVAVFCLKETPSKELLVGTSGLGIYRSSNDGETWVSSKTGWITNGCYSLAVSSNGIIYGGTDGLGVCYSTDNGNSWNKIINMGYYIGRVFSIAVTSHECIYVCPSEKFARNFNNGNGWEKIELFSDTNSFWLSTAVSINPQGHIFVSTWPFNLFRSTDNGISWESIRNSLPETPIRQIEIRPDGKIYIAMDTAGVFSSSDNGDTWHDMSEYLPDKFVSQIWCDQDENLYAGTPHGLYCFNKADSSWIPAQGCTWGAWVRALCQNSKGYLFVGTEGDGIFRSTQQMTAIKKKDVIESNDLPRKRPFVLYQKDATINFDLQKTSWVKITIINSLGKKVAVISDDCFKRGSHSISIKSKNFAKGIYFICIRLKSDIYIKKLAYLR